MDARRSHAVLWILLAASGCAPSLTRVDTLSLRRVAEADLRRVDEKEGKQLAVARDAHAKALADLAEARRVAQAAATDGNPAAEVKRAHLALDAATRGGEQAAIDQARLDQVIAEEGERLQRIKVAWLEAQVAWRERFAEAARLRIVAADAANELARAQLAAARAPADEALDLAPFRGQLGRAHQAWSEAAVPVAAARTAADARAAELTAEKTRYAQVRKVVLPPPIISTDTSAPVVKVAR